LLPLMICCRKGLRDLNSRYSYFMRLASQSIELKVFTWSPGQSLIGVKDINRYPKS
jgi:hypothetical protein